GRLSGTQKNIHDLVAQVQSEAIAGARPGVSYAQLHLGAQRALAEGLLNLNLLVGELDGLVESGVARRFFPHGLGHLLGLDVHDMEDLGDRAGLKEPEQERAAGLEFLRFDRPLEENMVLTVEPGFYQIPALLNELRADQLLAKSVNWTELAQYEDVSGIRIEDNIRITSEAPEVLSAPGSKSSR
ncbi:MAG: M24 family metallopeptidase, partial [Polyangiaceae bacterium]|nr:M24 family metallopeptidase [Polyangiaceae bacterium]